MGRKKAVPDEESNQMDDTQTNMEEEATEAGQPRTTRQYWIAVLRAHPSWLRERSNDKLYKQYLEDHPEVDEVPLKARQGLSTVKSQLRKGYKERKRGRKESTPDNGTPLPPPTAPSRARSRSTEELEHLEERIDAVLTQAKNLDNDELDHVVKLLKTARDAVIVLLHRD